MKKSAHSHLALLAIGVALALGACGDDDDKGDDDSNGSAGRAGSSSSAGRGGGGATAGRGGSSGGGGSQSGGSGEGDLCDTEADCSGGLKCVLSGFDDGTGVTVCARSCRGPNDCDQSKGEACGTLTDSPADGHCIDTQSEPLKSCGPGETSICDEEMGLICLPDFAMDQPVGTCFNLCRLPSTTSTSPVIVDSCPSGQTCVDIGGQTAGLCGFPVERGDACAITGGKLCKSGDICITEVNPDRTVGASLCFQECTLNGMCDDGKTCTPLDPNGSDQTKFCM